MVHQEAVATVLGSAISTAYCHRGGTGTPFFLCTHVYACTCIHIRTLYAVLLVYLHLHVYFIHIHSACEL